MAENEPRSESGPLRKTGSCTRLRRTPPEALGEVLAGALLVVVIGRAPFAELVLVEPVMSVVGLSAQAISALIDAGGIIVLWVVFRWLVDW